MTYPTMSPICQGLDGKGCGNLKATAKKHYCRECTLLNIQRKAEVKLRGAHHIKAYRKRQENTESGYPGVYRHHIGKDWTGCIFYKGVRISIGSWPTAKEANDARIELMFKICGQSELDLEAEKGKNTRRPQRISQEEAEAPNTPLERYDRVMQYLINIA